MPPAPTVVTGVRSSEVGIAQDRRVIDMRDRIWQYDPDVSPFLTILSSRADAVVAENPVFKHLEDQPLPWFDAVNNGAGYTATATAITVDNGIYFRGGDLVLNTRTGELMKVASVATNVVTVVRAYSGDGINGTAMLDNDWLHIIGNVNEEFLGARTIKSTTEAAAVNYCAIDRTPFGASQTLSGTRLYGGAERPYQRRKMATQHAFEIERSFLFSKKKETTGANGHRERSTGGLLSWITTNVVNANGTLTAATLEAFAEKLFRYGSSTKLLMASRRASSQLDLIAEGRLQTVARADTYGVAVRRFVSSHGELLFTTHDMLINDYAGYVIAVDLENVAKRYMRDDAGRPRDAQLRTNIQNNDEDGWKDEYLSEVGLHVMLESAHGYISGIV